jgi:hypothetical protein
MFSIGSWHVGTRLKYLSNQRIFWRGRLAMIRLCGRRESAFFMVFSVFTVFAASVACVQAEAKIHIIDISPSSASSGANVRVYGAGATPMAPVVASIEGPMGEVFQSNSSFPIIFASPTNLSLGWAFANESGDWEIRFVTPNVLPGTYFVNVFDNGSSTIDKVPFQVLISVVTVPVTLFSINSVEPSFGPPGRTVVVRGSGASSGEITVYFDEMVVGIVPPGRWGDWSVSFQVPETNAGNHEVKAVSAGMPTLITVVSFTVTSTVMSSIAMLPLSFYLTAGIAVVAVAVLLFLMICLKKRR